MRKNRNFKNQTFYHVYNRGNRKKNIFKDNYDRRMFLQYLSINMNKHQIVVTVFCLMNNHYHLLLMPTTKGSDLSNFMKALGMLYSRYYNKKYNVVGRMFQNRFQASEIKSLFRFINLIKYIFFNPLKGHLVKNKKDLLHYKWNNFAFYNTCLALPGTKRSMINNILILETKDYYLIYPPNAIKLIKYTQKHFHVEKILQSFIKDNVPGSARHVAN